MPVDYEALQAIGAIATAAGVAVAAFQLYQAAAQATTAFEDDLSKEYRELCASMPTKVFFGEALSNEELDVAIDEFYRYFDLSNSQVFLRQIGRVSSKTWTFWADGMRTNLALPSFLVAWERIEPRVGGSFSELRRAIEGGFRQDPRSWLPVAQ